MDLNTIFGPGFLNIAGIIPHLPIVLASVVWYKITHLVVGPLLRKLFIPYDPKNPPTERAIFWWNISMVSIAQSIVNTGVSIYLLWHSEFREGLTPQERILGYHEQTASALAITVGYFVFHLVQVWCNVEVEGKYMLAHSFATLFATSIAFVSYPTFWLMMLTLINLVATLINALSWCFNSVGNPKHLPRHSKTTR
jgi:hypothetical protein